jgi:hypothetical protein
MNPVEILLSSRGLFCWELTRVAEPSGLSIRQDSGRNAPGTTLSSRFDLLVSMGRPPVTEQQLQRLFNTAACHNALYQTGFSTPKISETSTPGVRPPQYPGSQESSPELIKSIKGHLRRARNLFFGGTRIARPAEPLNGTGVMKEPQQ